jgi:protein gp37
MEPEWVREIRDRCIRARVAFFFKQWGGVFKAKTGSALDGRTWNEMPVGIPERVRSRAGEDQLVVLA